MRVFKWEKTDKFTFTWYRSEICHFLKESGDADFIAAIVGERWVERFWEWQWYAEAFYLIAIVDYLSDLHNVERYGGYNTYRRYKLENVLYPQDVLINFRLQPEKYNPQMVIEQCKKDPCSRYFIRYNIVEGDIRDVA